MRRAAEPVGVGGFEIGYVTDDGLEHRVSLSQAWATPFESCSPIRRFTSHKGQRHLSGLWWSATTGGHVGFESWLERDHVLHLDFDPSVVGIASQPFWLSLDRRGGHDGSRTRRTALSTWLGLSGIGACRGWVGWVSVVWVRLRQSVR